MVLSEFTFSHTDYDWVRVGTSNAVNTTISAFYVLHGARAQPLVSRSVTS
jgi:hypothetical protein